MERSIVCKIGLWIESDTYKETVLRSIDLQDKDDASAQLTLEDVAVTIAYLIKNYESVSQSPLSLEDKLTTIVTKADVIPAFLESCMEQSPRSA